MPLRSRNAGRVALAAALIGGVAIAIPVFAQKSPESLLPPGFNSPAPPAAGPDQPVEATPAPAPAVPSEVPQLSLAPPAPGNTLEAAAQNATENAVDAKFAKQELPDWAKRPTTDIGPLTPEKSGMGTDAFGGSNGANGIYLAGMMRRLNAPIASRWASILLRRALLTDVPTPRAIDPANWVAARVWLLLRMGEADAARLLLEQIDVENYNPRLYEMALQTALATADPTAICPIAEQGGQLDGSDGWTLARAICAAFSGDGGTAGALIDQVRGKDHGNIDALLAERLTGAAQNSRRAVNIEWSGVYQLTSWRFGMASAVGLSIPDSLYDSVSPRVRMWQARAPMLALPDRLAAARLAATYGVLSNATLVDIYSQLFSAGDPNATDTPEAWLRTAYVGRDAGARIEALRKLWDKPADQRDRYADAILTARAAARITPADTHKDEIPSLIDAMLSAGLDIQAAHWAPIVASLSGSKGDEAWALLAVGSPKPVMALSDRRIAKFGARDGSDQRKRAQLLFAGLAGLGRLDQSDEESLAAELGVPIGARNTWTRAIDAAAAHRQDGTVALLAAVGLQSGDWRGIPAFQLFHIVQDLRQTGHEAEARMIAAEAVSRS